MTTKANSFTISSGQEWLNTRKNKIYLVVGFTEPCDSGSHQYTHVLYRDYNMPQACYRTRPISDWFGFNRDDEPRFVPYFILTEEQKRLIRKNAENDQKIVKKILIRMFYGDTFDEAFSTVFKLSGEEGTQKNHQ